MIRVGLTGGIGSGKSIIGEILMVMGFPVYNSDIEAKSLMVNNQELVSQVKQIFGEQAYIKGSLNRKYLADQIFSNPDLKEKLNSIVHPAVRQAFEAWCSNQASEIIFNEAAILFETGGYKDFDYNILVTAPEEVRIARVVSRDNTSIEEVKNRINSQWKDSEKKDLASFVITNDNHSLVTLQVEKIIQKIKATI